MRQQMISLMVNLTCKFTSFSFTLPTNQTCNIMAQSNPYKTVQMGHVVNLMSIAYRDGQITKDESGLLIKIAQDLGLSDEAFDECYALWKSTDENELPIAVPETDDDQVDYLRHFARLMVIDGEINADERQYLVDVANIFGYNGDEVVDILLEELSNEDDNEEEGGYSMDYGRSELSFKHVREAFDEMIIPTLKDPSNYQTLQAIVTVDTRMYLLTDKQIELVKKHAALGNVLAKFILGRYYFVVRPEDDSLDKCVGLFQAAAQEGLGDAMFSLGLMVQYGYFDKDVAEAKGFFDDALQKGSMMALKWQLRNVINGTYGEKSDPQRVIDFIGGHFFNEEDEDVIYAEFYAIMGDAYRKMGLKEKAEECYEKAVENGFFEAEYNKCLCQMEGANDMMLIACEMSVDFACDDDVPGCFTLRGDLLERTYEEKKDDQKPEITQKIREAYMHDLELGVAEGVYRLGRNYYFGEYGFEESDELAWECFIEGYKHEHAKSMLMLAQMIEEGHAPDDIPEGFMEACRRKAELRLGKDPAEMDADDMKYFAIIKSDGTADVFAFDPENWSEAPTLLYAKRLAPVRTNALDALAKELGMELRLTLWTNYNAPRMTMAQNQIASQLGESYIAGDVILTMEDNNFDPVFFFNPDQVKEVLEAMGIPTSETVLADFVPITKQKVEPLDYTQMKLRGNGYIARIQPDGTAHFITGGADTLTLLEEDIYDPARLPNLVELGEKLGLTGRLTAWIDNSALRKQQVMMMDKRNPIGCQFYPGAVADNLFIAMEDEHFYPFLFKDPEQLKQVVVALGVKPEHVVVGK